MQDVDGVLFVTPEYNRSMPAVIKNAVDVGSRPPHKSIWDGKAAGIVSVSPHGLGAFGANHHLRQALVFLNVPTMQQPEAYISNVKDHMSAKGELTDPKTKQLGKKFMDALDDWIQRNAR